MGGEGRESPTLVPTPPIGLRIPDGGYRVRINQGKPSGAPVVRSPTSQSGPRTTPKL